MERTKLAPPRGRKAVGLAAALIVQTLALLSPAPGQAALGNSPDGMVLVVSVNLYETDAGDARKTGDMRNFVDRLLNQVPYKPDVLLLQEVRAKSVASVKGFISNKTNQNYQAAVNAPENPWREVSETKLLGTDTAILINSTTMSKKAGGFFKTSYSLSQAASGSDVKAKRHAWALLQEKGNGGLEMPVVSLHYPKQREFSSQAVSESLKKQWSQSIANKLRKKYPSTDVRKPKVIAGDFNNFRCTNVGGDGCNETPAYALLTNSTYRYKDSILVIEGGASNPIDFIFTTGNVSTSGRDINYNTQTNDPDVFYSNHQFRWALIEGVDQTPPTSPGRITNAAGYGQFTRIRGWEKVHDGGSGFKHYEIYRSVGDDQNFTLRDTTTEQIYEDRQVTRGERYYYYVVAVDRAGNVSLPTNTVDVRAGG